MALVNITGNLLRDPKSLAALNSAFHLVEYVKDVNHTDYKILRVKGQGVPDSDSYINIEFGVDLKGNTKILGWQLAD